MAENNFILGPTRSSFISSNVKEVRIISSVIKTEIVPITLCKSMKELELKQELCVQIEEKN